MMSIGINKLKPLFPWWLKLSVKLALSFIPHKNILFRPLGLYKHGDMIDCRYVLDVLRYHLEQSGFYLDKRTILEFGPGDSVSTGIVAWVMGAERTILVDNGRYATDDVRVYKKLMHKLSDLGFERAKELLECSSFDQLLEASNIVYLTESLKSLRQIESDYVDFCFSQAVMEHVFLDQVEDTILELYRVQKKGSYGSHVIDFQDHLGGSLNSLRFSSLAWESPLFKKAGFYTNRIRCNKFLNSFKKEGFKIVKVKRDKWITLPLKARCFSKEFRYLMEDDLLTYGAYILCVK